MPGLVDLHYHTALGKGWSDHLPLWEYLQTCWYPMIRALDPEAAYWAALASYSESIRCGVTTVNDMYRQLRALADAAEEIGIRAVLSNDVADDEHDLDTLADNERGLPAKHGAANGRIEVYVGIEWLPLASEELLRDARALADELGTGIHIHLNESLTEVENSKQRFGRRPTEVAYDCGILGPDCIAAHCVWLSDTEIALMRETGTQISHNPRSNAKLGNGIARLPEMLAAGHQRRPRPRRGRVQQQPRHVRGDEVRLADAPRQPRRREPAAGARRACGWPPGTARARSGHETGQLERRPQGRRDPGRPAEPDVHAADARATPSTCSRTWCSRPTAAASTPRSSTGKVVMEGRKIITVDEQEVLREANGAFREVVARMVVPELAEV